MALSPTAVVAARRNVAQRIERFLAGLDRAHRPPNRRELYYLRQALHKLEAGQYPEGEDAMMRAEGPNAIPEHAANDLGTNAMATVTELQAELDRILKGEG